MRTRAILYIITFSVSLIISDNYFKLYGQDDVWIRVAETNVKLYEKPSIDSKVIKEMTYLYDDVIVQRRQSNISIVNGCRGYWVYVKASGGSGYGWVFDYYLAYKNRFKKITSWPYKGYSHCFVKRCVDYKFNRDGSFELFFDASNKYSASYCSSTKGDIMKDGSCRYRGHLYRYLNIIWARFDPKYNRHSDEYFFINSDGSFSLGL